MTDSPSMLQGLIAQADAIAGQARAALGPIASLRGDLRQYLLDQGDILPIPSAPAAPASMCAIDGGRVTDHLYAADLIAAVACTGDAHYAQGPVEGPHAEWAGLYPHTSELDRVAGTAMAALELQVAASAPHEVRLLDGSFLSPVIEARKGLSAKNSLVRGEVIALMNEFGFVDNLVSLLTPDPARPVYALPKSETATIWRDDVGKRLDRKFTVTDRILAAQVLEPGEMTAPRVLSEWDNSFLNPPAGEHSAAQAAGAALRAATEVARQRVSAGEFVTAYVRPPGGFGVIRVEFFRDGGEDLRTPGRVAALVCAETKAPHMVEPFAQYMADRRAKDVSAGVRALRAAVQRRLSGDEQQGWGALFANEYRS